MCDEKWDRWTRWIEAIHNEMIALHRSRCIYKRLFAMFDANASLQDGDELFFWMFANYSWMATMALRRLSSLELEKRDGPLNKQSLSLQNLLRDMRDDCALITRDRFVKQMLNGYDGRLLGREVAWWSAEFDGLAGQGARCLSPQMLDPHIAQLSAVSSRIKPFADKCLAHFDRLRPDATGYTYEDIDDMIDKTVEAFRVAHHVIKGSGEPVLPRDEHDWEAVLTIPWKPDE